MPDTLVIKTSLCHFTDEELLEGFKRFTYGKHLEQYQFEFYNRFAPYVFRIAIHMCARFKDGEDLAKEITQLTFISAFKAIAKFNYDKNISEKNIKMFVKAWLGKIANNNFNKLYAQIKNSEIDIENIDIIEPSYDLFQTMFDPPPEEQPSEIMIQLQQAINQLKEMDKHIVLTYAAENCLNSTIHISDSAMKILCDTYNTTSENIRQRKNRSLKKIKLFCLKN
ncbi:MAG: sigma-70 family polymerase sigma factor [Mucilaginibacter sp.]|nr:sigma-70 family polymerase sigma factor [Mucilaginibacter sp.]